jgi:hypothetical protein
MKKTNEAKYLKKSSKQKFTQKLDSVVVEHGQVRIWQPRDDEGKIHVFHFAKEDVKNDSPSVMQISYVFRWAGCRIVDQNHKSDVFCHCQVFN